MMEAEHTGLKVAPLAEESRVCEELFNPIRGEVSVSSPVPVEWFHHPGCTSDLWPVCLGEWLYALPPAMQEAIRQGEEVFTQLMVHLSITPAVNPHIQQAINQGEDEALAAVKVDGPFEPNGFRFGGIEVQFKAAYTQYRLVLALRDFKQCRPRPRRTVQEVIEEVYVDDGGEVTSRKVKGGF